VQQYNRREFYGAFAFFYSFTEIFIWMFWFSNDFYFVLLNIVFRGWMLFRHCPGVVILSHCIFILLVPNQELLYTKVHWKRRRHLKDCESYVKYF
jgi:hypothetical protein